ncbi:MAG: hypothetical protein ACK4XG_09370 [Chromatiaceae bacterium]
MRRILLSLSWLVLWPVHAAELLLMSMSPAELYQAQHSTYLPVAMVQQVLRYYPAPYKIETVSLNRALAGMRSTEGACVSGVRKSAARQDEFLYSEPYVIAPDVRLLLKTDSPWVNRLKTMQDKDGRVSLARLLALTHPPVLVTEDGRTYGATIDPILSAHRKSKAVYIRTSKVSRFGETLPMLTKGFVDMALEYSVAIAPQELSQLQTFKLLEADPFALAFFACKRDAETAEILQQLNRAILTFRDKPEFQSMLLEPFPPAERAEAWQAWLRLTGGR